MGEKGIIFFSPATCKVFLEPQPIQVETPEEKEARSESLYNKSRRGSRNAAPGPGI